MEQQKPMLAQDFIDYVSKLPDADDVIAGILPPKEVMIICGDPYKGKSLETQRLACQFPIGGDYHGLRVKKCESAYLTWEGSLKGLAKRFAKFVKDIPKEKQPVLQKLNDPMHLNTPQGYLDFTKVISEIKKIRDIKVILVDSFTYTVRGAYKDDVVINEWWSAVQRLSQELDVTFIFVWEFTKPIIFKGEEVGMYDLNRLKSAYTTAYKVNTVVAMGELDKVVTPTGQKSKRTKSPQIVVMKAKDAGMLPPLNVTLDSETLCFNGEVWELDEEKQEYKAVKYICLEEAE